MAEAEDVITDAARHATIYAQELWRRHRGARRKGAQLEPPALTDFVSAASTCSSPPSSASRTRSAQPSLRRRPACSEGCSASRGCHAAAGRARQPTAPSIWLPSTLDDCAEAEALDRYPGDGAAAGHACRPRQRGEQSPHVRSQVARRIPGAGGPCRGRGNRSDPAGNGAGHRPAVAEALADAPGAHARSVAGLPAVRAFARSRLAARCGIRPQLPGADAGRLAGGSTDLLAGIRAGEGDTHERRSGGLLLRDWWTGDLRAPAAVGRARRRQRARACGRTRTVSRLRSRAAHGLRARRSARRPSRTRTRRGRVPSWSQTAQPHEHAEDPGGLQRPPDHDRGHTGG